MTTNTPIHETPPALEEKPKKRGFIWLIAFLIVAVTTLCRYVRLQPARTVAMLCGPEIMMRFVTRELESRGLQESDIYLSMERNMKCAVGFCGHCQYGPYFICKDGPVFPYSRVRSLLEKHEI